MARGLVPSREQASRLIMAGLVKVDGITIDKRGKLVEPDTNLEVKNSSLPFVSRGGGKLAAALEEFQVDCQEVIALDVGASTGGFTDCLLQRGASRVYAVDVGYGQLDWKIRRDPRVVVLDRCNIRYLDPNVIPDSIHVAVIDVSFISLKLVLPCLTSFLAEAAMIVALVKPQFEVGKGKVGRGGIVRDETQRLEIVEQILCFGETLGFQRVGWLDSPVVGRKGNREVLVGFRWVNA